MHKSSHARMRDFVDRHLDRSRPLLVCDLGSMDVCGSYRDLFDNPGWTYRGLDLEPGPNVDLVLKHPYRWTEIRNHSVDVFVSGQALEHVEFFWLTLRLISRKLKPGGLACIIAPSRGHEHRFPVDCWRFYPDGFRALAKWAGLELLEVDCQWQAEGWDDGSDEWGDTRGIFRKPVASFAQRLKGKLGRTLGGEAW